jgi:hypothetical protein
VDRLRAWLVVCPLVAAGTLVAHAGAYRLTGTPSGALHAYLAHAPQAVLVACVLAIALAGLGARLRAPSPWTFAALAPLAFLVQEHVERVVHTGHVSWILTTPAVLVGLLLQAPLGLISWHVARRLLRALAVPRARRARLGRLLVPLAAPLERAVVLAPVGTPSARAPPSSRRP